MTNELVINATKDGFRIALLKDKGLLEYHIDEKDNKFTVGDIYLGKVKKLAPSLNASFIDVGYKKDAFLHYSDLGPQFKSLRKFLQLAKKGSKSLHDLSNFKIEPSVEKLGKISDILTKDQTVLVQVVKEPISTKGPRLSTELSIAGRYMILVPFTDTVSISKKIVSHEECTRLTRLISSIKPKNFGVIVRTAAEGREAAKLDKDLKDLLKKWEAGVNTLRGAVHRDLVIGEMNRASSILRDMLSETFDAIVIDDKKAYEDIKAYIQKIAPEKEKIVKHHQGKAKIFEQFGIEKQLKMLFGQTVSMEEGGYLIIEHTEAMHVVDVNSGNKTITDDDQDEMIFKVNLAAAKEVARQLRLRDMGGIIVVDFIDMRDAEHKRQLYQAMKDYLQQDRSRTKVLPLSRFGLMQITRQRVRPEMNVVTQEQCPSCGGTGNIAASILVSETIERNLEMILTQQNESGVALFLHPYLYAYFTCGLFSKRLRWFLKYWKWVQMHADSSLGLTEFQFVNKHGEAIELNAK